MISITSVVNPYGRTTLSPRKPAPTARYVDTLGCPNNRVQCIEKHNRKREGRNTRRVTQVQASHHHKQRARRNRDAVNPVLEHQETKTRRNLSCERLPINTLLRRYGERGIECFRVVVLVEQNLLPAALTVRRRRVESP